MKILSIAVLAIFALVSLAHAGSVEDVKAGQAAGLKGDYAKAKSLFTRAIKVGDLPPRRQAVVFFFRGNANEGLNKLREAVADYTTAVKLKPDFPEAFNRRGFSNYSMRRYKRAVADFTQAVKLNPNFHRAYENRGLSYEKLGQNAKANADFLKAKALRDKGAGR